MGGSVNVGKRRKVLNYRLQWNALGMHLEQRLDTTLTQRVKIKQFS